MLVVGGVAVDYNRMNVAANRLQSAVDQAALALAEGKAGAGDLSQTARRYTEANLKTYGSTVTSATAVKNDDGSYTVAATAQTPTILSKLFMPTTSVTRNSTAKATSSTAMAAFAIGTRLAQLNGGRCSTPFSGGCWERISPCR